MQCFVILVTLLVDVATAKANLRSVFKNGTPNFGEEGLKHFYPEKKASPGTLINELNLLMSHDSGCTVFTGPRSESTPKKGGAQHVAVTQDKTLVDQFKAGIRVFDVRVNENGFFHHELRPVTKLFIKADYEFLPAGQEFTKLAGAVAHTGSFALIKFKGDKDAAKIIKDAAGPIFFDAPFSSAENTVGSIAGKIVLLHDDCETYPTACFKKAMNAEELKISQFTKVFTSITVEEIVKSRLGLKAAGCAKGKTIRIGCSNTGVTHSPLCQAYNNRWLVRDAIDATIKMVLENGCSVIFSTDGSVGVITKPIEFVRDSCDGLDPKEEKEAVVRSRSAILDPENKAPFDDEHMPDDQAKWPAHSIVTPEEYDGRI